MLVSSITGEDVVVKARCCGLESIRGGASCGRLQGVDSLSWIDNTQRTAGSFQRIKAMPLLM